MSIKAVRIVKVPIVIPPCFLNEIREFKSLKMRRGESQADFLKRKACKLERVKDCILAMTHQAEYEELLTNFKTSNPLFVQTKYFKGLNL